MKITKYGGVYIGTYSETLDFIKLGKSNNIYARFENLNTAVFENNYKLLYVIYPTNASKYNSGMLLYIEKSLHRILDEYRKQKNKEFFTIPKANLYEILSNAVKEFSKYNFNVSITDNEENLKHVHENRREIAEDIHYVLDRNVINTSQGDSVINTSQGESIINTLRPKYYQIPVLDKLVAHYKTRTNKNKGILVLPPGYGKSYMAAFLIKQNLYDRVLILTPYDKICYDFGKALMLCGIKNVYVKPNINDALLKRGVYVTTYQTYSNKKEFLYESPFELVIYDEAHHLVTGNEWNDSLQLDINNKLFLTATPKIIQLNENCEEVKNDILHDSSFSMDNKELFGSIIHQETIEDCIEKELLCNYKLYVCDHDDGVYSICEELINDHHRKRIILFFNTIKKARDVCKEIQAVINTENLNWKIWDIEGNTKHSDREIIFDEFDMIDNIPKIICNVNVISEGANLVLTDSIVFAEKRNSPIGIIQNIGRGLRTHYTKDFAIIVMPKDMNTSTTIINALRMHDSRVTNKAMFAGKVSNEKVNNVLKNLYNKCHLIEVKNKKITNKQFIELLKKENIYSEYEYRQKFSPDFDEPFVENPTELYTGFDWDILTNARQFLTFENAKKTISDLLDDEKVQIELSKINICSKKYQYLRTLNDRLPPNPKTFYNIKKYNELNERFKEFTRFRT